MLKVTFRVVMVPVTIQRTYAKILGKKVQENDSQEISLLLVKSTMD